MRFYRNCCSWLWECFFLCAVALFLLPVLSLAQSGFPYSNGVYYASAFNVAFGPAEFNAPIPGQAGTINFASGAIALPDSSIHLFPFTPGASLEMEQGSQTISFTLQTSTCADAMGSCQATAIFSQPVLGRFVIRSATAGLQEAIDCVSEAGGGMIIVTDDWRSVTPLSSLLSIIKPNANVVIQDLQQGFDIFYSDVNGQYIPIWSLSPGSGSVQSAANITAASIAAQSTDGILNAAQFPGVDVGQRLNAAEAALPAYGGVIDATQLNGPLVLSTPVVFSKPTTLLVGYQQWDCSSINIARAPCILFEASGSALIGPQMVGAGPSANGYQMFLWQGDPSGPGAIIKFEQSATSQIAYCTVKNIKLDMVETGTEAPGTVPNIQGIEFVNPVFDDVKNVYIHHDSLNYTPRDATNDSTQGLVFTSTYRSQVPPPGFSSVTNYLDTNDDSNGVEQSAGTQTGSAGLLFTHGTGDDALSDMMVSGPCNIEDVAYGIKMDGVTDSKISSGCFTQTYPWGVYLDGAQINEIDFLRVNLNSVPGNGAYYIDSASYDNKFVQAVFYGAASGQTVYGTDNGVRTSWDSTSIGQVNPVYAAGPVSGAAATSTANVNSYAPVFAGNYWNGTSDASCAVSQGLYFGIGANPAATLQWNNSGCPGGAPNYNFIGNELSLTNNSSYLVWNALNNGITLQNDDSRIDVNNLLTPAAWFDLGGTPTAERNVTFPDANSNTIQPAAPAANEWVTNIDSSGVQHLSQPSAANLSNGVTGAGAVVLADGAAVNAASLQVSGNSVSSVVVNGTIMIIPSAAVGCLDTTATATGATTSMIVSVSPGSLPAADANTTWNAYVSAANTVDIHICTIAAITPVAASYNWEVISH